MVANATATPASATEAYEFESESLASSRELIRTEGIRGTRLHPVERVVSGRLTPGGSIAMEPTATELLNLLPRCIAAPVGSTYTVGDTALPYFQTIIDRVSRVWTYTGCKVDSAAFHASIGKPLSLTLNIEAINESVGAALTFGSLTINPTAPFVLFDGALTLDGTAYQFNDLSINVNWHLKKDRFVNSQIRTDLPSMDLSVECSFTLPATSDTIPSLYDTDVGGIAGTAIFSAGGATLSFLMSGLIFPAEKQPAVGSKDEITLKLTSEARRVGSTAPLIVTLV